jgi:glutamate synthase domain-containing protein 1
MTATKTHFAYRVDRNSVMEHVAGVDDLMVAKATYQAACKRRPGECITLPQGARVIEDSRENRLA